MSKLQVEKTSNYLEKEKLYGVSLRSVEPYGTHGWTRKHIYATAHFHKKEEKAFALAWKDFYRQKDFIDREDRRADSRKIEVVEIEV